VRGSEGGHGSKKVENHCYRPCFTATGSCMLHGSETWPVKKENKMAHQQAEMR